MPKIKFIRDTNEYEGGPHVKGDTLECSEDSARRWLKRNAAKIADDAGSKPTKAVDAPPADKSVKSPPADKSVSSPRKKKGKKPVE